MFKILVAVDGSNHTARTLRRVVEMCTQMKTSEVWLINVQPEPIVYGEIAAYLSEAKAKAMAQAAGQRIVDEAVHTLGAAGIEAHCYVEIGEAATVIAERADEHGFNLIALGTRGMGVIGNLVMGSVATKVVHLSKTPVMLVH